MSPAPPRTIAPPRTPRSTAGDRVYMTEREYLAFLETSERPFEWINGRGRRRRGEELGEVRPAQGYDEYGDPALATEPHNTIAWNLAGLLWNSLRRTEFTSHQGAMAVRDPAGPYYFPDLLIYGDPGTFEPHPDGSRLVLRNPLVVFEILSRSRARTDRGEKLAAYHRIASVTDYLIVSQDAPHVLHHRRDGGGWADAAHAGLDSAVTLAAPAVTLPLAEVYERVAF